MVITFPFTKLVILFFVSQNIVINCYPIKSRTVVDENSNLFEGDLINFDENTVQFIKSQDFQFMSAQVQSKYKWPNATIPYIFNSEFGNEFRQILDKAMKEIESVTCIRFVQLKQMEQKPVVRIFLIEAQKDKCGATIGRNESGPNFLLGSEGGCSEFGTLVHELIHLIGFVHEQCREDRDEFIRVNIENVKEGRTQNFLKYPYPYNVYTPYDYSSIMHYASHDFAKGTSSTIEPLEKNVIIGQREEMSRFDKIKINKYYECGENVAECKDRLSTEECNEKGLGLNEKRIYDPKKSRCLDEKWSKENCPKTCGDCYRLFATNKRKL